MASQKQVKEPNAKTTSEREHTHNHTVCSVKKIVLHVVNGLCLFVSVLKELTMKILNCMSSFISLPAVIQRLLQVCMWTLSILSALT